MDRKTFDSYIDAYNTADWHAVAGYYTSDIQFESFGRTYVGLEVRDFLKRLHLGVRDEMTVSKITMADDTIAIEANTSIVALTDVPHLPAGPLKAGEQRTVSMSVIYKTRGDQICAIQVRDLPSSSTY